MVELRWELIWATVPVEHGYKRWREMANVMALADILYLQGIKGKSKVRSSLRRGKCGGLENIESKVVWGRFRVRSCPVVLQLLRSQTITTTILIEWSGGAFVARSLARNVAAMIGLFWFWGVVFLMEGGRRGFRLGVFSGRFKRRMVGGSEIPGYRELVVGVDIRCLYLGSESMDIPGSISRPTGYYCQ